MQLLTPDQCASYCLERAIQCSSSSSPSLSFVGKDDCHVYTGKWQVGAGHGTAEMLLARGVPKRFAGGLLWFTGAFVSDRTQWTLFQLVRKGLGVSGDDPGHRFEANEFDDLCALLGLIMDFGWDCYVIDARGDFFLNVTNELMVDVVVGAPTLSPRWLQALVGCDFKKRADWVRHFCR